jgi:Icc-related predicted phosphoesterase
MDGWMIIDCVSDLHGFSPKLEGGDLLIIAGDLTARDTPLQHLDFLEWLKQQPYKEKIVIAGNHDNFIHKLKPKYIHEVQTLSNGMKYLCDSGTEFEGLKVWGSPWTKTFKGMNPHCKAFTVDTEEELEVKFSLIPNDIDILITHSPPYEFYDRTIRGESVGSKSLLIRLAEIKPLIHCFGHIHENGGKSEFLPWKKNNKLGTHIINASIMNERYKPVNKPVRIEL